MKLKLTSREKTLLAILGICLVAAILYYLVIKPQLDMVNRLEQQAKQYSVTIEQMKERVNPDNLTYKEYNELYNKTFTLLESFYPTIVQEKIILMLEDKIKNSGIDVVSITFTEPSQTDLQKEKAEQSQTVQQNELEALTEQIKGELKASSESKTTVNETQKSPLLLEKMTATINFKGSYTKLYNLIKSIEDEKRSIVGSNLTIEANGGSLLTGVLVLDFYSIPKPFDQDQGYLKWDIKGDYGKLSPFGGSESTTAPEVPATNP